MSSQYNGRPSTVASNLPSAVNISSSTNLSPCTVTTATPHNLNTGDDVFISGHLVNVALNGLKQNVLVLSPTQFNVNITPTAAGGATGTAIQAAFGTTYAIPSDGTDDFTAASVDVAFEALGDYGAFLAGQLGFRGSTGIFSAAQDFDNTQIEQFTTNAFVDASAVIISVSNCVNGDVLYAGLTMTCVVVAPDHSHFCDARLVARDDMDGTPSAAVSLNGARAKLSDGMNRFSVSIQGVWTVARAGRTQINLQGKCDTSGGANNLFVYDAWHLRVMRFHPKSFGLSVYA